MFSDKDREFDRFGWWRVEGVVNMRDAVLDGPGKGEPLAITKTLKGLQAAAAADETRDAAVLAAVKALADAGGVDAAPIVAAIKAEAAATRTLVEQAHQAEMAELRKAHDAEVAGLHAELEALKG